MSVFTIQFQVSQDFAVRQMEVMVNNNINKEQSKVCTEGEVFIILYAIYYWKKNPQKSIDTYIFSKI